MQLSARGVGLLSLLAIVPVVAYAVGRADVGIAIAVVNVVLIAASLYVVFSGDETRIIRSING